MGTSMIVRKMQPHELDATLLVVNYYTQEAQESMPEMAEQFDDNSILNTVRHYASHWDHCWFNIYDNQRPVGFIAGYATECPWNANIIDANIAFVYLLDSHRSIENFRMLMDQFTQWARTIKAKNITGGDIGINPEKMQKLYEHFGFKPLLMMTKELTDE